MIYDIDHVTLCTDGIRCSSIEAQDDLCIILDHDGEHDHQF